MNYEEICNLRILGDSTVGKTSILLRFTEDIFNSFCMTTVGIDYHFKDLTINNRNVRIKIWDTAGQERYKSFTSSFFRNADGVILVFDVTSIDTFLNLKYWIESLKSNLGSHYTTTQIIIIGNKIDLKDKRQITFEEVDKFCLDYNLPYFECSAKDSTNIDKCIIFLVEKVFQDLSCDDVLCRDSFNINDTKNNKIKRKNCCNN